ncbi:MULTISPECIES: restriction endonuclease [Nitrosococcus]|uniref:Restriction endonuclease n=3 Tax=Nitrosococcus TaxID=1227 RepID=Q3JF73_NITOC|nr:MULTISPECIES: restriction endonuclease [Nitrosococcus]KFI17789.1 restriction endonuclease [Nitrosococcus oceani C-27]ABA56523.1 Restriction endonuclease [Nitrosococcus oceani ATCC 19707]ADJ29897.1 restriction endonuclease [Nitrosococcus watsonii C-113]EDZ65262.1 Restriction endonuclease family [Nitrosococcus oceani AFC27]BBM60798.1 restriction endonuclease [Nitrosococcus oceani]
MARRRSNIVESMYGIFLRTPWWVSLLVAGTAYAALNFGLPAYIDESNLFLKPFEPLGPLFAPWVTGFVLLTGAFAQLGKRSRRKLLNRQSGLDSIRAMSWQSFEKLVGECYRRQGYRVEEKGGEGADGGVDLVLRRQGEVILVQCKQWKTRQVGVAKVRELYGVVAGENATRGILVTCGQFTPDARAFAKGKALELVEGTTLLERISEVQKHSKTDPGIVPKRAQSTQVDPNCPLCGKSMVLRKARKGRNAGKKFWGCIAFPQCRGVRNCP